MKLSLKEIMESMQLQSNELEAVLNKNTGKIELITESMKEESGLLDPEGNPDWLESEMQLLNQIDNTPEEYVYLPSQFDIHEYKIMQDFIRTIPDSSKAKKLDYLIRGGGAFRRFKDAVNEFGIENDWYKYRDQRLREIAVEWCNNNKLDFVDDI